MRGIFWNSRGLSDLAKTKFLADTAREKKSKFHCFDRNWEERF